jgi:hypothetical protein
MFGKRLVPVLLSGFLIGTPAGAAPPKEKTEPEYMAAFRQAYEMKDGEYVKRVAKPWIPARTEFHLRAYGPPAKDPEVEEKNREQFKKLENWMTLVIDQDGNKLTQRYCISHAYLATAPQLQRGENLHEVSSAVERITGLSAPEFVIDPKHKDDPLFAKDNFTVNGDFVVRKNAPPDKLAVQLGAIFRDQCKVDVDLKVVEEVQDVFVVSGTFKLKPPEWRGTKKLLEVYATDDGLNKDYDHFNPNRVYTGRVNSIQYSGNPMSFVRFLGERVKTRMLWEGDVPDGPKFSWNNHVVFNPTEQEQADDVDPAKVLKHATEQCGLTFKKERRKVPVMVLSPAGKK